jgi:hypothetical protein
MRTIARRAVAFAALLLIAPASTRAEDGSAAPICQEDRAGGAAPTYTMRFDPKDGAPASSAFLRARDRAGRYCAQQACTLGGEAAARLPHVYGVGGLRRGRLIVGFRCVGVAALADARARPTMRYVLEQPSAIDDAVAQARAECAGIAAPELVDLFESEGKLVALFACGF